MFCSPSKNESFVEILSSKSRNFIVTGVYRSPQGDKKVFENHCKDFLTKKSASSKTVFMVEDLNINSFDYDNNELVKNFFNLIFESGFLPLYRGQPEKQEQHQLQLTR